MKILKSIINYKENHNDYSKKMKIYKLRFPSNEVCIIKYWPAWWDENGNLQALYAVTEETGEHNYSKWAYYKQYSYTSFVTRNWNSIQCPPPVTNDTKITHIKSSYIYKHSKSKALIKIKKSHCHNQTFKIASNISYYLRHLTTVISLSELVFSRKFFSLRVGYFPWHNYELRF